MGFGNLKVSLVVLGLWQGWGRDKWRCSGAGGEHLLGSATWAATD